MDKFIKNMLGNVIYSVLGDVLSIGLTVSNSVARVVDGQLSEDVSEFIMGFHGISQLFDMDNQATVGTPFCIGFQLCQRCRKS